MQVAADGSLFPSKEAGHAAKTRHDEQGKGTRFGNAQASVEIHRYIELIERIKEVWRPCVKGRIGRDVNRRIGFVKLVEPQISVAVVDVCRLLEISHKLKDLLSIFVERS